MKKRLKFLVAMVFATLLSANVFAYDFVVNGIYYNINSDGTTVSVTSGNDSYSGNVTIPSTVTYNGTTYSVTGIGGNAFYDCTGLTSVTIGNSVTTIGDGAFYNCTGLTSVTIPNSVTTIGYGAFYNCTGLTTINYNAVNCSGGGFTPYADYWLGDCDNITTVNIGDSVQTIPPYFMYQKSGLTSVTIPNSVTTIGGWAFEGCTGLTSVTIGNSVTTIGEYAFEDCTGLTSVTIGNSVTTIGIKAFNGCTSLSVLQIGTSVNTIEDRAFYKCSGLNTIDCKAENPPVLGSAVFGSINKDNVTVIVPCEKSSLYQNAIGWSLFNNIVENCESSIDVVEENQILVYPNPAKENITLRADEDIFIYNSLGQIVKQINNPKGETTISISDLPRGIYYLKTGNKQQKLIKE